MLHVGRKGKGATGDDLMEIMHILSFKGYCATEHGVEENSKTPDIGSEALVASI